MDPIATASGIVAATAEALAGHFPRRRTTSGGGALGTPYRSKVQCGCGTMLTGIGATEDEADRDRARAWAAHVALVVAGAAEAARADS